MMFVITPSDVADGIFLIMVAIVAVSLWLDRRNSR